MVKAKDQPPTTTFSFLPNAANKISISHHLPGQWKRTFLLLLIFTDLAVVASMFKQVCLSPNSYMKKRWRKENEKKKRFFGQLIALSDIVICFSSLVCFFFNNLNMMTWPIPALIDGRWGHPDVYLIPACFLGLLLCVHSKNQKRHPYTTPG